MQSPGPRPDFAPFSLRFLNVLLEARRISRPKSFFFLNVFPNFPNLPSLCVPTRDKSGARDGRTGTWVDVENTTFGLAGSAGG